VNNSVANTTPVSLEDLKKLFDSLPKQPNMSRAYLVIPPDVNLGFNLINPVVFETDDMWDSKPFRFRTQFDYRFPVIPSYALLKDIHPCPEPVRVEWKAPVPPAPVLMWQYGGIALVLGVIFLLAGSLT
jgi:hypothetical protein